MDWSNLSDKKDKEKCRERGGGEMSKCIEGKETVEKENKDR